MPWGSTQILLQIPVWKLTAASQHTYNPATPIPAGFERVSNILDPSTGWQVPIEQLTSQFGLIHPEVWRDPQTGQIIVAFRGTDINDSNDKAADVQIMRGQEIPAAAEQ